MNEQLGFAVQAIQSILAPAIMVSACGLLLLGLLNRYSVVMGRIRNLNDERRRLLRAATPPEDAAPDEVARLASLMRQLDDLFRRVRLLRDAVVCQVAAVGVFVLSSLLLALRVAGPDWLRLVHPLPVFIIGMGLVFTGVIFEALDVLRAYSTIRLELADLVEDGESR